MSSYQEQGGTLPLHESSTQNFIFLKGTKMIKDDAP